MIIYQSGGVMLEKNIIYQIQSEYAYLTSVEKRIADLLLRDPKSFIEYTAAELSSLADISQGSINNFSKRCGAAGFSEFKLKVAEALPFYEKIPFSGIEKSSSIKDVMKLKMEGILSAFRNTLEINDEEALKSAVNKILNARRIEVYGVFYSGIAAKDFARQLIQLGIQASFISDMLLCAVSASMLESEDLVIAVSMSGSTKDILDAAGNAKKNGASVIAITSNKRSKLAALSDIVLLTASSGSTQSGSDSEIKLSEMYVIDTLCAYIQSIVDASGEKYYYRLRKITESHSVEKGN